MSYTILFHPAPDARPILEALASRDVELFRPAPPQSDDGPTPITPAEALTLDSVLIRHYIGVTENYLRLRLGGPDSSPDLRSITRRWLSIHALLPVIREAAGRPILEIHEIADDDIPTAFIKGTDDEALCWIAEDDGGITISADDDPVRPASDRGDIRVVGDDRRLRPASVEEAARISDEGESWVHQVLLLDESNSVVPIGELPLDWQAEEHDRLVASLCELMLRREEKVYNQWRGSLRRRGVTPPADYDEVLLVWLGLGPSGSS